MNPFEQLLTQPSGSNVPPETLEMLGRQASQLFQSQGVPLNQALSQVLSNHPELGNEHVKRIIEFANTVTFQEMFQNSEDKNVHFDVADPGVVLRDLKDGGSSSHSGRPLNADYQRPPQQSQQSGSNSDVDAALMQQFTGSSTPINEATKVASIADLDHEKHANPLEDAYDAMIRLQATREKLAESHERMHSMLGDAQEDFYKQVKQQVTDSDGSGLGGVLGALEKVASPELLETMMVPIAERLVKEGYDQQHLTKSLRKTAGVAPNLEHPLFSSFDAILKLACEIVTCDQAISDVDKMLEDIKVPFKKIAGALTTGVKKVVGHQGHVPAGIRQRFPKD
jgi:hypothetical protein